MNSKCLFLFAILISIMISCSRDITNDLTEHDIDSIMIDFSPQWADDSVGQVGFRNEHHSFDTLTKTRLINGVSFQGYREPDIIRWLGRPNDSFRHFEDNGLIMRYSIEQDIKGEVGKSLLIYFDKDDRVSGIVLKTEF